MTEVRKWDRSSLNDLFMKNDRAVERALIVLFNRQTADEKRTETTRVLNNRGFTAADADILSSLAKQVQRGRTLSPKQLGICRKAGKNGICRLARYHRQLIEEIKIKETQKCLTTRTM